MSLVKSLNSGVSGLNAFQTKMDTIGNNISNVNTTGFKSSKVSFSELLSEDIGGAGGGSSAPSNSNQVGLGVRVASVDRDFSQGSLQNTGKNTDLAIEGEGFFMVNNGAQNFLTRNGSFTFNKNGDLVDQSGNFVQGYNANGSGNIISGGTPGSINIDFENALPPQQTSQVTLAGNLDADTSTYQVLQAQSSFTDGSGNVATGTTLIDNLSQASGTIQGDDTIDLTINGTATSIDITGTDDLETLRLNLETEINNIAGAGSAEVSLVDGIFVLRNTQMGDNSLDISNISYNDGGTNTGADNFNFPSFQSVQDGETNTETMSTTVYDDLGRAHTLLLDFTQTAQNEWSYQANFADGETINSVTGPATIDFDSSGQITGGGNINIDYDPGTGVGTSTFSVSLGDAAEGTELTQYSGANTAKVVGQDGYTQGSLVDININGDGHVQGIYDNGENMDLAQIALAEVENEQGLDMLEGGRYQASSAAGEIFVNTAENISSTEISSGTLESSNVDLAKEFTEMITAQRAYQSNARVITTSDEMLTEAVNLKR